MEKKKGSMINKRYCQGHGIAPPSTVPYCFAASIYWPSQPLQPHNKLAGLLIKAPKKGSENNSSKTFYSSKTEDDR